MLSRPRLKYLSLLALLTLSVPVWTMPYVTSELTSATQRYETIARDGGWDELSDGVTLRKGEKSDTVAQLVRRLLVSGDLQADTDNFDDSVEQAVKNFQERHGLEADGVVGPDTIRAMNVSIERRLEQLRAADRQIREIDLSGGRYVLVNIPQYRLHYVDNDESVLDMRVIVGKAAWDTPTMSDTIEYLVFNPHWNLPVEIVAEELAPKVARNPQYLADNNMTVLEGSWDSDRVVDSTSIDWHNVRVDNFPYFVRQEAGPDNPLGTVKFIFPNNDDIYLHDTPDTHLFGRENRAQSHGCIRVEEPKALAGAILGDQAAVESALAVEEPVKLELDVPVPVHLVYWTAWVDTDGKVHFRDDIYDRVE